MKTSYELRVQNKLQPVKNPDSDYKKIDRAPKVFAPLLIPKNLENTLPFKSKEKFRESKKQKIEKQQNQGIPKIFATDKQKMVAAMIQRINLIRNQKARLKQDKSKQKQRIKAAREKPRQQHYSAQKKQHKREKYQSQARLKSKGRTAQQNDE